MPDFFSLLFSALDLGANNHDFGGLNQRSRGVADLQLHFLNCIGGDDRRNLLPADRKLHLRHQPAGLDLHHSANQLVASADMPEVAPACRARLLTQAMQKLVYFALRDAVMAAGRANASYLSLVD